MSLLDMLQRKISYMRLSVTDRCNLRCCYCMPAEGVSDCGHNEILRYEDLLRISRVAAILGIEKVRVTGGEPLVRKGVIGLLEQINGIPGINEVVLTTNGTLLKDMAGEVKAAGVHRVNVSIDSLQPDTYRMITRGGEINQVFEGLKRAEKVGLHLKLNMVVMRGINDQEVEDFAALSLDRDWSVRFIEYMPTIREKVWQTRLISGGEIQDRLQQSFAIEPIPADHLCGPARPYRIRGAKGTLGVITPLSEHFCGSCNRIRVTSRGLAKSCLLSETATDLRPHLKKGNDRELRNALASVTAAKAPHHQFLDDVGGNTAFSMSSIGG